MVARGRGTEEGLTQVGFHSSPVRGSMPSQRRKYWFLRSPIC